MSLWLLGVSVKDGIQDAALKVVFFNAALNPIFHGLCRRNYRKGYDYLTQLFCYRATCGFFSKPGGKRSVLFTMFSFVSIQHSSNK